MCLSTVHISFPVLFIYLLIDLLCMITATIKYVVFGYCLFSSFMIKKHTHTHEQDFVVVSIFEFYYFLGHSHVFFINITIKITIQFIN